MDIEYKSASIEGLSDEGNGEFDAVLSTETKDRDGESLKISDWAQPLPDSIPIDVDHAMSVEKTIGVAVPRIEDGQMKMHVKMAATPLAQQVRGMLRDGIVKSVSVAFRNLPPETKDGTTVRRRELLNAGVVNTPANPEAIITGVKSGARNNASDAKAIQAIHDHACALGASCGAKSERDVETKSSGAAAPDIEETGPDGSPVSTVSADAPTDVTAPEGAPDSDEEQALVTRMKAWQFIAAELQLENLED